MKQTIRMSESQLREIISETIRKILNENVFKHSDKGERLDYMKQKAKGHFKSLTHPGSAEGDKGYEEATYGNPYDKRTMAYAKRHGYDNVEYDKKNGVFNKKQK